MRIVGTLHTDDGREVGFTMNNHSYGMWVWTVGPSPGLSVEQRVADTSVINKMAIGLNSGKDGSSDSSSPALTLTERGAAVVESGLTVRQAHEILHPDKDDRRWQMAAEILQLLDEAGFVIVRKNQPPQ